MLSESDRATRAGIVNWGDDTVNWVTPVTPRFFGVIQS